MNYEKRSNQINELINMMNLIGKKSIPLLSPSIESLNELIPDDLNPYIDIKFNIENHQIIIRGSFESMDYPLYERASFLFSIERSSSIDNSIKYIPKFRSSMNINKEDLEEDHIIWESIDDRIELLEDQKMELEFKYGF